MNISKIDNPHELISGHEISTVIRSKLGQHHPACLLIQVTRLILQKDLSESCRALVSSTWQSSYVDCLWLLRCLANFGEVLPVVWIKSDSLAHLLSTPNTGLELCIASAEDFSATPESYSLKCMAVTATWNWLLPRLENSNAICQPEPTRDGCYHWRDGLVLSKLLDGDSEILQVAEEWSPWYRVQDVQRILGIITQDTLRSSPFGDTPVRDLARVATEIHKKYGLEIVRKATYYPEAFMLNPKLANIVSKYRQRIIRIFKRDGITLKSAEGLLPAWLDVLPVMCRKLPRAEEAVALCPSAMKGVPVESSREIVAELRKISTFARRTGFTDSAIDSAEQAIFNHTPKTFEYHWNKIQVPRKIET